ncbi:YfcC family protein [Thalassotalea aquiviva]|uniref:YfcC family protein n=1 Tax=Thalassotalea aquiviva TaxID=3242415 RepID=UPI00352A179C
MNASPKKTFQMPTVYTILFSIIVMVAALTWILPAGKYNYVVEGTDQIVLAQDVKDYSGDGRLLPVPNTFTELQQSPQGVIEVLKAPIQGFHKAVDISLFILIIGGFLAVTMATGALDAGVVAIVKAFEGKEQLMIPVLITLFALGGSTFGLAEETVAFWAVILPVMTAAGYDRMVTAGVILLGSGIGVLSSTVNPFATGIASGFAGLSIGEGIGLRLIQLVILITITSIFVMRYAAKIKADKNKSVLADITFNDEFSHVNDNVSEFTGKQKLTMSIFAGTFLLMIYGVIPWSDLGVNAVPTLGWWFDELSTLFFTSAILIGLLNRMGERDFVGTFLEGAKDLMGVALVVAVARGIFVIMDNGMIIDTILNWAEGMVGGLSSGVFVVVAYLVHIVLSFFISSTSGLATVSMPLMAPLADFSGVGRDLMITAYQSASGIINLFAPTAAHLVAGLALAKIPYGRFIKWVMPFIAIIFVVTIIVLYLAAMFG